MSEPLTHLDDHGRARMVDVGDKPAMKRTAVAVGAFVAQKATLDRLMGAPGSEPLPKGEALAVARLAGIAAAKRTGELVTLCHPLQIDHVAVDFERTGDDRLEVRATVSTTAKTGVEMEALTAVTVACLNLYDMAKAVDKQLRIEDVHLLSKTKQPIA